MTMTTQARYEVGIDGIGSISGYCRTRKVSFREALRLFELAKTDKYMVRNPIAYVYDRMARIGQPELWHVENGDMIVKSVRNA